MKNSGTQLRQNDYGNNYDSIAYQDAYVQASSAYNMWNSGLNLV